MIPFKSIHQNRRFPSAASMFLVLLVGLLAGPQQMDAQSISSYNPHAGVAGQPVTMILTGINTNFTVATGCYLRSVNQPGYTIQATSFLANSSTDAVAHYSLPPNAPLGNYSLCSDGYWTPTGAGFNVTAGQGSNYGLVSGKVIQDNNSNCVEDGGDAPMVGQVVQIQPGPFYVTTDNTGAYATWLPLGNYTVALPNNPNCLPVSCPVGGLHNASLPNSMSTDAGNDFFLDHPSICYDLTAHGASGTLRPGFVCELRALFGNIGVDPTPTGVGEFIMDSNFTFISASVAPSQIIGDTLRWNLGSFAPMSYTTIYIDATLSALVPIGTMLPFYCNATSSQPESNYINNHFFRLGEVGGSFDPNDKQVFGPDGRSADDSISGTIRDLDYLIRCQNTGTDTAFNIFVRDTLDPSLDLSTLRVTASSHPYELVLSDSNIVEFVFHNILLVDSVHNEPLSHAFVEYHVELKPGLPNGTVVRNRASIYFDFNQPVVTNYTTTTLCKPLDPAFSAVGLGAWTYHFIDQSDTSAIAWQWDFGDGSSSNLQHPNHTYAVGGTYIVCLTATNACYSETHCDTVVTCAAPAPAFAYQLAGPIVTFQDLSHPSCTGWHWDFGDGSTSTVHQPTHNYAVSAAYNVCLVVTGPCFSDSICQLVDLCEPTNPAISYVVNGWTVDFVGTGSPSVYNWRWDFGDGHQAFAQNATHTYTTYGPHEVCLFAANACNSATTCDTLAGVVGLVPADLTATSQLQVYPNPSMGVFQIAMNTSPGKRLCFQVFDARGILLQTAFATTSTDAFTQMLDLSSYANGLYLLAVSHGNSIEYIHLQKAD